jgi:transcriptional regulator with XRE-family HTH domain
MGEASAFVEAIKRCIKAKGMTYADLARVLGLSEANVKRMFSLESLTLKRIEQIVSALDMNLYEVAKLATSKASASASELSLDQEKALARDPRLFSLFHLLLFGLSLAKIARDYQIAQIEAEKGVRELERLGLVERGRRDKIVVRVSRAIVWRPNGPLRQTYEKPVRAHFLGGDFAGPRELRRFMTHRLSPASQAVIERKLKRLLADMDALSEIDTTTDGDEPEVSGLFVAFRPFTFEGLVGLRRRS